MSIAEQAQKANDVSKAEILWALQAMNTHQSNSSQSAISTVFAAMFPDSAIAQKFSVGETKMRYLVKHGLAPYFKDLLLGYVKNVPWVLMFDESLNKATQQKQLDVMVRFWDPKKNLVVSRYWTSVFMGHATAADLMSAITSSVKQLPLCAVLQLSMDGPYVNWSLYENFELHMKDNHNIKLLNTGSCGLHQLHGAFMLAVKATDWRVADLLQALYTLMKNTPARREDYTDVTGSKVFPQKYCKHRWLDNGPALQRAIDVMGDMALYFFDKLQYAKLFDLIKQVLTLSHGQAAVERGFSVNKECLQDNMDPTSVTARRVVLDHIRSVGGVLRVDIDSGMKASCRMAYSRYKLELESKKGESEESKKRKLEEEKELDNQQKSLFMKMSETARMSYSLYEEENKAVESVASIRGLKTSTIFNHLSEAIKIGLPLDIDRLGISARIIDLITNVIRQPPINSDISRLTPIKDQLPDHVQFHHIKVVIAILQRRYGSPEGASVIPLGSADKSASVTMATTSRSSNNKSQKSSQGSQREASAKRKLPAWMVNSQSSPSSGPKKVKKKGSLFSK
ncbi:hypothetical protein CAPTEDRAFT_214721 [Capitella teleta]|uniref:Helicase Helix-turn-helix domain-containing protein n=1 Tax=Capitella teleta TaxID=283909 RepID=R7UM34_CAPTE|nr:hypothetical protein CAPTEDRAFT_214721 [Capitella teleta]|eukprot:ELU04337.1 hypothetical protein CAPTEDRAFT_214721 [Capitella teleta]